MFEINIITINDDVYHVLHYHELPLTIFLYYFKVICVLGITY